MKTELIPTSELQPGDKLFIPWPEDQDKPEWHRLPEVVTVKRIEGRKIIIEESGGLCIETVEQKEFNRVIADEPKAGDTITFKMEWFNDIGLMEIKEFRLKVIRISRDPMKNHKPKCIVEISDEQYGITFDMISNIEKPQKPQLELFEL